MSEPSTPSQQPQQPTLTPQQLQQCWNMFVDALHKVFANWTALTLAVEHGFGGSSSQDKANNLIQETIKFFQTVDHSNKCLGKRVYSDELAENFETFMINDMRTDCEDGSCSEVAELLCNVHKECFSGNFDRVNQLVGTKANSSTQSQYLNPEGISSSDSEGEDDGEESGERPAGDVDMMDVVEEPKAPQKIVDEDGFETVVPKGRRGPRR